jgi:hypothetical protein
MTGSSAIVDSTRVARAAVASCVTQRALLVDEHSGAELAARHGLSDRRMRL